MTYLEMVTAGYLRERARQCRLMARRAQSHGIAGELERMACDYDLDAARAEIFALDRMSRRGDSSCHFANANNRASVGGEIGGQNR